MTTHNAEPQPIPNTTKLGRVTPPPTLEQRAISLAASFVKLLDDFEQYRPYVIMLAVAWAFGLGVIDHLTQAQYILQGLYMAPILAITVTLGFRAGMLFLFLCMAAVTTLHIVENTVATDTLVLNTAVRFLAGAGAVAVVWVLLEGVRQEMRRARLDMLTGIPNRRAFFEYAEAILAKAHQRNFPFSLAYIDADDFKAVNDIDGHDTGDEARRLLARTITRFIRKGDIVARLGGDEFVVLLPDADPQEARHIIEQVHTRLAEACMLNSVEMTFSIGVVTFLVLPATVDEAVARADEVMYYIKKRGGNATQQLIWDEAQERGEAFLRSIPSKVSRDKDWDGH